MALEQPPTNMENGRSEMATVTIKKSGDEGIDVGLVDHYTSLGYIFKETSPSGSVEMEIPRERAAQIQKASIDEHYRRAKGAERAAVGPEINLVEDRTEFPSPKSAKDFLGTLGLESEPAE